MIVHILALLYIFMGLAVICDDFFVASLEQISDYLSLSEDVAAPPSWQPAARRRSFSSRSPTT